MIKRITQIAVLVLTLPLLMGCGEKQCVDADDWGYPKVYVPANGDNMNLQGEMAEQSVDGIGPGQVLLDAENAQLVITIDPDDKWTSWLGGTKKASWKTYGTGKSNWFDVEDLIPEAKECLYEEVQLGDDSSTATTAPKYRKARARYPDGSTFACPGKTDKLMDKDGTTPLGPDQYADCWVPCWFKDGMGLYVGLAPRTLKSSGVMEGAYASSRNEDGVRLVDRVVVARHIPDPKNPYAPKVFDPRTNEANNDEREQDGYLIKGFPADELPGAMTGDALFFKIVDSFYEDNYGGYYVKIKSGTRNPRMGPLETAFHAFSEPVKAMMERIYKGVVENPEFINGVRALLALYIVFFAYAYLMGMVDKPRSDFIAQMVKFAIIIQLISPGSWEFFYNNFFSAFVDGILQIGVLIATPFADYDPQAPWYSMDQMLAKFASAETAAKVGSTLFSNAAGFLFIFVFYIALAMFIISAIKALTIYIVAYMGIAFMVALAPIFLIFILFEKTRDIFEELIAQLMAFSIQQIILFAGLGIFAALLFYFLSEAVGYRVCWESWFTFAPLGYTIVDLKYWFPNIRDLRADLWMDWGRGISEFYTEYRPYTTGVPSLWPFMDLPYLDPEKELLKIGEYRSGHDFLKWGDVFVFAAASYFMFAFMSFIPVLSASMKGAGSKYASADAYSGGFRLWGIGKAAGSGMFGKVEVDYDEMVGGGGSWKKKLDTAKRKGTISIFGMKWNMGALGGGIRLGNKVIKEMESLGKDGTDFVSGVYGRFAGKNTPDQKSPAASSSSSAAGAGSPAGSGSTSGGSTGGSTGDTGAGMAAGGQPQGANITGAEITQATPEEGRSSTVYNSSIDIPQQIRQGQQRQQDIASQAQKGIKDKRKQPHADSSKAAGEQQGRKPVSAERPGILPEDMATRRERHEGAGLIKSFEGQEMQGGNADAMEGARQAEAQQKANAERARETQSASDARQQAEEQRKKEREIENRRQTLLHRAEQLQNDINALPEGDPKREPLERRKKQLHDELGRL